MATQTFHAQQGSDPADEQYLGIGSRRILRVGFIAERRGNDNYDEYQKQFMHHSPIIYEPMVSDSSTRVPSPLSCVATMNG